MARYTFSGDARELGRRAEEGILPILQSQPGFKSYAVIASGNEIISYSAWESEAQAEAASPVVADWVANNMAGDLELQEVRTGEILFATALGISTIAGAHT